MSKAQIILAACLLGSALAGPVRMVRRADDSYPPVLQTPPASMTPKAWTDALNAAIAAGKIPNIPVASVDSVGNINYPGGAGYDPQTCSWTMTKCLGPEDVTEAPANTIAISFDDGPTYVSDDLYAFLQENDQSSTHFMIGSNVLQYRDNFMKAVAQGNQQFSVHTWSHSLQTTKTNEEIVAELGWTMQIIYDFSGYVPNTWRPPQGDVDNRVRAIASEVFGLKTILWNHDTNDWCLNDQGGSACPNEEPGKDYDSVVNSITPWIDGAKNPGLIILEHELSHASISVFKNYYPKLKGLGWTPHCIADLFGWDWYNNAKDSSVKGTVVDSVALPDTQGISGEGSSSSSSSSTSTYAPSSTTSSASSPSTTSSSSSSGPSSPSTTTSTSSNSKTATNIQHQASPSASSTGVVADLSHKNGAPTLEPVKGLLIGAAVCIGSLIAMLS